MMGDSSSSSEPAEDAEGTVIKGTGAAEVKQLVSWSSAHVLKNGVLLREDGRFESTPQACLVGC